MIAPPITATLAVAIDQQEFDTVRSAGKNYDAVAIEQLEKEMRRR